MIWKRYPFLNFEILGLFVNTLTADENYPFGDSGDLQLPIKMQLSEKGKTFSELFVSLKESPTNFEHFPIKDDCTS